MKNSKLFIKIVACIGIVMSYGTIAGSMSLTMPQITEKKLDNGLRLVAVYHPAAPRTLMQVVYDVGAAHEADDEKGLAHLVEHMIFKGTEKLQEGALDGIARCYGAQLNACTSFDFTSYYFEVTKNNWQPFLEIFADCMQNVTFDSQHLASEVKTVVQELRMNNDSVGCQLFHGMFKSIFPKDHPYYPCIIGYKKDLAAVTSEKLKAFYKKYYKPSRATVFAVGDFDVQEFFKKAESVFKDIPNTNDDIADPYQKEYTLTTSVDKKVYLPRPDRSLDVAKILPALTDEQRDKIRFCKTMMNMDLPGTLRQYLIDEKQVAVSCECYFQETKMINIVGVFMLPKDGCADACVQAVQEYFQMLTERGVTSSLVRGMQALIALQHERAMETITKPGCISIGEYILSHDVGRMFTTAVRCQDYTVRDCNQIIEQFFTFDPIVRVEAAPMDDEQKAVWAQEQVAEQEVEAEIFKAHQRTTPIIAPDLSGWDLKPQPLKENFLPLNYFTVASNYLEIAGMLHDRTHLAIGKFTLRPEFGDTKLEAMFGSLLKLAFEQSVLGSKADHAQWLAERGVNLEIGEDGFSYVCLPQDFYTVTAWLFKLFLHPVSSQENWQKIKDLWIEELKERKEEMRPLLHRQCMNALYPGSDVDWTFEQMMDLAEQMTVEQAVDHYRRIFAPQNMIFSCAGNIVAQDIDYLMYYQFGEWPRADHVYQANTTRRRSADGGNHIINLPRDQVMLAYVRHACPEKNARNYALAFLAETLLFGSLGSRMYKLREETGLFYAAHGGLGKYSRATTEHDFFWLLISPEKRDEVKKIIDAFINKNLTAPVSEDDFQSARFLVQNRISQQFVGVASQAAVANFYAGEMLGADFYSDIQRELDDLTLQDLSDFLVERYGDLQFTQFVLGNF